MSDWPTYPQPPEGDPVATVALAAHMADVALDGGPHGLPALPADGMAWVRQGGALTAVDVATGAELDAEVADRAAADIAEANARTAGLVAHEMDTGVLRTSLDAGGSPVVALMSTWGIGATGDPYYDPAGAVASEAAVLVALPSVTTLSESAGSVVGSTSEAGDLFLVQV